VYWPPNGRFISVIKSKLRGSSHFLITIYQGVIFIDQTSFNFGGFDNSTLEGGGAFLNPLFWKKNFNLFRKNSHNPLNFPVHTKKSTPPPSKNFWILPWMENRFIWLIIFPLSASFVCVFRYFYSLNPVEILLLPCCHFSLPFVKSETLFDSFLFSSSI